MDSTSHLELLDSPNTSSSGSNSKAPSDNVDEDAEWQNLDLLLLTPAISKRALMASADSLFPSIIVIGAGPVGLWTTIQVALMCPDLPIVVFEKHAEYQRRHVVKLSSRSMENTVQDGKLLDLINRLPRVVRTSVLEEELFTLAVTLGNVSIVHEAITDIKALAARFPTASIIIGADGAHSLVRKQLFGVDLGMHEVLQYVVEVKYEVEGVARRMRRMDQAYPTLKLMQHLAEEFVRAPRLENGKTITPVTLRMQVTREEYVVLKDATFKDPAILRTQKDDIPHLLAHDICIWMNAKRKLFNERSINERLVAVVLSVYSAADFAAALRLADKSVACFVVGDAAFGVPFYRSLNNGFICGSQLANCLVQYLAKHDQEARDRYRSFVHHLSQKEIGRAKKHRSAFSLGRLMIKINSFAPWQVIFWSKESVEELEAGNPFA